MADTEKCVLALYDCRSKQEYIYRTNRIREISGGSALLADVYKMFFRKADEKGIKINSDWKKNSGLSALPKAAVTGRSSMRAAEICL